LNPIGVEPFAPRDVWVDRGVPEERMTSDFPSGGERSDGGRNIGGDNAFARLEEEMAAMKNAIGNLSGQIAHAGSDIGAAAQEQAKRGLSHARANAGALAADASDRLSAAADIAKSQASSLGDSLEDVVRERPLSAVALALGLGFLFGVIWRR
jgi:ElaB/YqjD/DUF883 family membrane-anchored ribosome-binding protein